ncbi:MATE family efflux transporter, partial [Planctomycetota bacterium]
MTGLGPDKTLVHTHKPGSIRELLAIALPMVVSQGCDTVMIFTDRLFLSKLGALQMNAAFSGGLACFTMMTFFWGLIGYSTALVAQNLGAKRPEKCGVATTQAMLIVLAAYPLILLIRPLVHWAFHRVGVHPEQLGLQIA